MQTMSNFADETNDVSTTPTCHYKKISVFPSSSDNRHETAKDSQVSE